MALNVENTQGSGINIGSDNAVGGLFLLWQHILNTFMMWHFLRLCTAILIWREDSKPPFFKITLKFSTKNDTLHENSNLYFLKVIVIFLRKFKILAIL